jgi:hypothetical protein
LLVACITFFGALAIARADASDAAPAPAAPHARKKRRPAKAAGPKASDKCATDEDCAFTALADGQCCPSLCPPRPVAKASAYALEEYAAACPKHDQCPVPECAPPPMTRVPACVSGRCVARAAASPTRE